MKSGSSNYCVTEHHPIEAKSVKVQVQSSSFLHLGEIYQVLGCSLNIYDGCYPWNNRLQLQDGKDNSPVIYQFKPAAAQKGPIAQELS